MKNKTNIEELFKEKLSGYKADVPADAWKGVQSGLQSTAGSAAGAAGTLVAAKLATAVVAAILVAGTIAGVVLYNNDTTNEKPFEAQTERSIEEETIEQPVQKKETDDQNNQSRTRSLTVEEEPAASIENTDIVKSNQRANNRENSNSGSQETQIATNRNQKETESNHDSVSAQDEKDELLKGESDKSQPTDSDEGVAQKIAENKFVSQTLVTPSGGKAPLVVELSCEGDLQRAKWDFGDGEPESDEQYTTHEFTEPGTYIVSFTGQKANGEIFTESVQITVEAPDARSAKEEPLPPALINVPNVFTPNGDGVNDVLKVTAENIKEYTLKIYNRGGQIVFETRDKNKVWNGSDKSGNALHTGLFFYQIRAKGIDGNLYQPKGSIQIRR